MFNAGKYIQETVLFYPNDNTAFLFGGDARITDTANDTEGQLYNQLLIRESNPPFGQSTTGKPGFKKRKLIVQLTLTYG